MYLSITGTNSTDYS